MIEKIQHIKNPLTIIALFAGLAEIAVTVTIKLLTPELQTTYLRFAMFFQVLIVLLFFGTLLFKSKVLYAPSDFKDEQNFVTLMLGVKQTLENVPEQIETAKKQIVDDVKKEIGITGEKEGIIKEAVDKRLVSVQSSIEDWANSVNDTLKTMKELDTDHWKYLNLLLNANYQKPNDEKRPTFAKYKLLETLYGSGKEKLPFTELVSLSPSFVTTNIFRLLNDLVIEGYIENRDGEIVLLPKLKNMSEQELNRLLP
jgi:hypothetical protein